MSLQVCTVVTGQFSPSGASPQSETLTGSRVGDIVFLVYSGTDPLAGSVSAFFEQTISVVDKIQQTSGGSLAGDDPLTVILFRPICG